MTADTIHDPVAGPQADIAKRAIPRSARNRTIVAALLVLTVAASVWQFVITEDTSHALVPLRLAVADIGQNVAEFHIWLEELLQGDEHLSRAEVMGLLDAVDERIEAIITHGQYNGTQIPMIEDANLRATLADLRDQVLELRSIARQRFTMGDRGLSGTEIDQQFDGHYSLVMSTYGRVVSNLDTHIGDNLARVSSISLLLIFLSVVVKILIIALMLSSHRSLHHLITELGHEIQRTDSALREANRSQRAKSAFLAMMSHELRTPLNAIMGFSEMMKMEMFGALQLKYKEYSQLIHSSAQRFLSIVNTMIDISRIEGGNLKSSYECTDLAHLLEEVHDMLRPHAVDRDVSIAVDRQTGAETVMADRKLLGDIVVNILHNAIKFTPAGGQVRIVCRRCADRVEITVEDTGIGMTEDQIDMAMNAFSQVDPHLARAGEGSGLGLPLAKMATESLGGVFSISSRKGVGTHVRVSLPRGA